MINAILMMLVLGTFLGLLLGIAGIYFTVEVDDRVEVVTTMLPGYNCGACGYAGCNGLATALVNGEAQSPTQCKPSKQEQRDRITSFLSSGVDPMAEPVHAHSHS